MPAPALNLAALNALVSQCGCCELPRCCPPLLECISFNGRAEGVGFLPPDSGSEDSAELPDWQKIRYLRRVRSRTGVSPADVYNAHPSGSGTYLARSITVDWVQREIEEFPRSFEASIGSIEGGSCRSIESPLEVRCEWTGGFTYREYAVQLWYGTYVYYLALEEVSTIEDIEGEAIPDPPPPPADGFYPPCTSRQTFTRTYWTLDGTAPGAGPRLVDDTEESPNPETWSTVPVSNLRGQDGAEWITTLEEPITLLQFFSQAEEWMDGQMEEALDDFIAGGGSDSSGCAPSPECGALKLAAPDAGSPSQPSLSLNSFRYRWKLNKCCGYKSILSGWREVFFPLAYMRWYESLAGLGSSEEAPPPPVDLEALALTRQWQWDGVPPLCNDSSSASSELDPFDYEPMWSPWSLTVRVPTGEEGRVVLRNYFQICYGTIPDVMPEVTGQINLSDSIPDGWTL